MNVLPEGWEKWLVLLPILVAFAGAMIAVIKVAWKGYRALQGACLVVGNIYGEFRPNGGSTLRDAIDGLKEDMKGIREMAEAAVDKADGLREITEHQTGQLDDIQERVPPKP